MIISDEHKFAFVHIPKCAGTWVRQQIQSIDSYDGKFFNIATHPRVGSIDYSHLPLPVVKELFPEEFAKLQSYETVALIRDPYSRFVSSVFQRLRNKDVPASYFDETLLRKEAYEVMKRLEGHELIIEPEYIHFSKQVNYIELDGTKVVKNIFRMNEIKEFAKLVEDIVGISINIDEPVNKSMVSRYAFVRALQMRFRPYYSAMLSGHARTRIMTGMKRVGLYASPDKIHDALLADAGIRSFVGRYYEQDVRLYNDLGDGSSSS